MMTEGAFLQARDEHSVIAPAPYVSGQPGYGHGPYFVLFNISSGRQGDRREGLIRKYFEDAGVSVRLFPIHRHSILPFVVGHAADLALSAQGTLVIAGGDGTINTALPSVMKWGVPLGILPCGTCNHAAQRLGIPLDLRAAVHTLIEGEVVEAHLGLVNDRPFLHSASLGLYPRILEEHERSKDKPGRLLVLTSAASFLMRRRAHTYNLQIHADRGELWDDAPAQLEAATLLVGNHARDDVPQAETRRIFSSPPPLSAIALRAPSASRLVEMGVRAALGSLRNSKDVPTFSFERLIIKKHPAVDPAIKVTLDGEPLYVKGPLIIERAPEPIQVIVPSSHSNSSTRLSLNKAGDRDY